MAQLNAPQAKEQLRPLIELASRAADSFVKAYYDIYDNRPNQLLGFYKSSSAISWNGNAFNGPAFATMVLMELPSRTHEIISYDAQPMLMTRTLDGRCSFTVTGTLFPQVKYLDIIDSSAIVHGNVQYSKQLRRRFTQTAILTPDPDRQDAHFISNDCFRFV